MRFVSALRPFTLVIYILDRFVRATDLCAAAQLIFVSILRSPIIDRLKLVYGEKYTHKLSFCKVVLI